MQLLSLVFWKKVWNWCKVNWKFIVGFAIPCIVLYFINQKKAVNILRKGIEFRKKQIDIVQRASDLESEGKRKSAEEFATRVEEVISDHEEALLDLDKNVQDQREKLGGSETVDITKKLSDRFGLDNKDKQGGE